MSGVITQLGAVGRQDADTFLQPSITFWRGVSKRHTQFAMEPKHIEFQGSYGYGKTTSSLLPRNGDLLPRMWLVISVSNIAGGSGAARLVDDAGRFMCEEIRLEMGSVKFDIQYAEHSHALEELSKCLDKQCGRLTGKSQSEAELVEWAKYPQKFYIPLEFWCFKKWDQALPIVALHLTDCKVYVKLRNKNELIKSATAAPYVIQQDDLQILDMYLLSETVFLDDLERDWFAEQTQKYVITQRQTPGITSVIAGVRETKIDLTLNHPCKYLMVLYRKQSSVDNKEPFNFSGEEVGQYAGEAFRTMSLKLNGNDRLEKQDPHYFRIIQPLQHFERKPDKHVYVYSFALYPNDQNPSGTLNFSRIDNAKLLLEYTNPLTEAGEIIIYLENINTCTVAAGVILLKFAS
jgi:hypothetical protein